MKKKIGAIIILVILVGMSLFAAIKVDWSGEAQKKPGELSVASLENQGMIEGLPSQDRENILKGVIPSLYGFSVKAETSLTAPNYANNMQISAQRNGIMVTSNDEGEWNIGINLKGFGRGDSMTDLNPTQPQAEANVIEFDREGLTEWYINDERGLKQGFTVDVPPRGRDSGLPLRLEMVVRGNLGGHVTSDGQAVLFTANDGTSVLRYDELSVWDAEGSELPAEIVMERDILTILIDDLFASYPITIDPLISIELYKLKAYDAQADSKFGYSVSLSGDTAVVGAPYHDLDGAAYVFKLYGETWVEEAKLTASDANMEDRFGYSVAIEGDVIIVGAPEDDDPVIGLDAGSVYVFERQFDFLTGAIWWDETEKLTASSMISHARFGHSVAIGGERIYPTPTGDITISPVTILIGAPYDEDPSLGVRTGSVYVFEYFYSLMGFTPYWAETVKLMANDNADTDYFGRSVAIFGETAVVGAPMDDDNGYDSGSAYVFDLEFIGTTTLWNQLAKLTASDGVSMDLFGNSVAISEETVVVGAPFGDLSISDSGTVYVFEKPSSDWSDSNENAKLSASDDSNNDFFGISVSISGNVVVVGAPRDDNLFTDSGSVYVFEKPGTGWVDMIEDKKLIVSDANQDDEFGYSISIYEGTIMVGAPQDDGIPAFPSPLLDSGSVYVHHLLRDTDGDGLPDDWEINGIDHNNDGVIDLDLAALGADPNHKDLFVEVDAMVGRAPNPATVAVPSWATSTGTVLDNAVVIFDSVPNQLVNNPDGLDGIRLHIQVDETDIPLMDFPNAFVQFDIVKAQRFGTPTQRVDPNWINIRSSRALVYRYAIFANTIWGSTYSGVGERPGNDFMVTFGAWPTPGGTDEQQIGTFIHELGHNLNLHHGGFSTTNYKPNYMSVMNYMFTMFGVNGAFTYSVGLQLPIDEDPNDNGVLDPGEDQNNDGVAGESYSFWTGTNSVWIDLDPADDNIYDFNDWSNLWYSLRGHPNFEEGVHIDIIDDELTFEQFQQLNVGRAEIDIDPDTLNLKSKGRWITGRIELLSGMDVNDIDISTVNISEINGYPVDIPAESHPTGVGDYDNDGVPDLMVKFDREEVFIGVGPCNNELTIRGQLTSGMFFEGSDIIKVISPGK